MSVNLNRRGAAMIAAVSQAGGVFRSPASAFRAYLEKKREREPPRGAAPRRRRREKKTVFFV